MKKVLFICTANVCRSPMAEAIFNALAEDKGLDFRARSAGVAALKDELIAPNSRVALEAMGVYPNDHSARQVSTEMLEEADLVLTMNPRHTAKLRKDFGDSSKIHTLPEPAAPPAKKGSPTPTEAPCSPTRPPPASSLG